MRSFGELIFCVIVGAACLVLVSGCDEDSEKKSDGDTTVNPGVSGRLKKSGPYAAITIVGESSFFGVVESLGLNTYKVRDNVETSGMFIHTHDRRVFLIPGSTGGKSDDVEVYDVADDNSFSKAGTITAPAGAQPGDVLVVDDETAYLALEVLGVIWRFDPSTLEKTGEIDLREYAVGDDDSETPEDHSAEPVSMAAKDGKLYVALCQSYNSQMMGRDGMWVAVIDMESNTVETVIEETTRGYAYAGRPGGTGEAMFFDEKGDLYVVAMASWGWVPGQKSGFLRIRAGEETFDPDWELQLTDTKFKKNKETLTADYILQATYAGDGIVYASAHIPSHESNPPDWVNDKNYTTIKIDLYKKTIEALPLPDTNSYCSEVLVDGELLVTAVLRSEGAGLYAYDISKDEVIGAPAVQVEGMIHMMSPIGE